MAEKEYVITIKVPDGDGVSATAPPVASEGSEAAKTPQAADKNIGRYIASRTIEPMINSAVTAVTSNIGAYTGSNELQQRVNFAQQMVGTATSTVSNIMGATAIAGSIGAGLGIGLLVSAFSFGISYMQKYIQTELSKTKEKEQLSLARARYDPAYNQSRS